MKRRFVILCLLFLTLLCACDEKKSPTEDFTFDMVDGEIIITGYVGTEREIVIPDEINDRPVTTIGEKAFYKYDMTSIWIPDSVQIIGENAFASCKCLEEVRLPQSDLRIELGAFYECDALTEVTLPDTLQFLGSGAFGYCDNLKELRLPERFSGFDIQFQNWAEYSQNGVATVRSGEKICSPVIGDTTSLVVKADSEAFKIIHEKGYGDVRFILDGATEEITQEEKTQWVISKRTQEMLISENKTVTEYEYNDEGMLVNQIITTWKNEEEEGDPVILEFTLDSRGNAIECRQTQNGEVLVEMVCKNEYDESGNLIGREEYVDGELLTERKWEYNAQGKLVCTWARTITQGMTMENEVQQLYDENGILCMIITKQEHWYSDGQMGETTTYQSVQCDSMGRILMITDVDENGREQDQYQVYEYDEHGNTIKISTYVNGELWIVISNEYIKIK